MTVCHYSDVLQVAARLCGLDYAMESAASGLSVDEERILRVAVNSQLQTLWHKGKWPGITRVEQRGFRADYASGTTYAAGTEVFFAQTQKYYHAVRSGGFSGEAPADAEDELNAAYWAESLTEYSAEDYAGATAYVAGDQVYYPATDTFYQCHTASTGNVPTDTDFWGPLVPFDAYISYTQTGETEIWEQGEIVLWDSNPRTSTRAMRVGSFLSENGVQAIAVYPARPWVEYKIRVPNLAGEVWDDTETYAVGDQVQFETTSGAVPVIDFYNCTEATAVEESPATDAAKWARVEIPDLFRTYLGAKGAVAFLLGEEDARLTVAEAMAAEAENNLNDLLYRVQGQTPRTRVLTY